MAGQGEMSARMRRITADWAQIQKDFTGHPNIVVTPISGQPPEKYRVTYYVNGIYLLPDGQIQIQGRHEVEIVLHADYPRYKPLCKILTPIWHPNFRDGQVCIGDIWGAGESLSDIIINIGDMIQYKSWNSYSPLSADAAQWAMEHKHIFPIGTVDLYKADYTTANVQVEIDLFDEKDGKTDEKEEIIPVPDENGEEGIAAGLETAAAAAEVTEQEPVNDFEIAAHELAGIEFVPTAQRIQTLAQGGVVQKQKINFKTVFTKGLLWGLIGGIIGFILQEVMDGVAGIDSIVNWMGYSFSELMDMEVGLALPIYNTAVNITSAFFSAFIACSIGLLMGLGEGIHYGSREKALKYAGIGAGISLGIGFISGYIAQVMYTQMLSDTASSFSASLVRGVGWSVMGLGVGLAVGLIKPEKKRIGFCALGGLAGGFLGGFLFDSMYLLFAAGEEDTGTFARAVGIVLMGLLIGLGIGLLEQFSKSAWLKVVRGEFEGKEYLVFAGVTSIGNGGKNTIALFKDKLVGQHHCDIVLEGSRYTLIDQGTPTGTVVNGRRITRHALRQGDAIAIGNSVLVFNTK